MSENKVTVQSQFEKYPSVIPTFVITAVSIAVLYLLSDYILDLKAANEIGIAFAKQAFKGIFTPNWSEVFDMSKTGVPYLLLETFCIAFLGTLFGTILSIPFAFFSARNITNYTCSLIGLTVISIIRAFPSFLYGMIFVKIVGTGAFAGVLTMTISSMGMLTKLLIEAIEDMDKGVLEALDAAGCNTYQKIRYGIIPQLSSNIVSTIIYRLDINIKNASILGIVGAGGIGYELLASISGKRWHTTGAYLLGIVVLTISFEYFSTKLRSKLARGE